MNRMGKMCLCLLLLAAGCGAAAEEEQTVQGGVCFRFEGNQTPENWKKMAEVFERGGGRFSASFHTQSIAGRADYAALLKRLSDAGHELLDGTPDNRMFAIHARSAEELERYRKDWGSGSPAGPGSICRWRERSSRWRRGKTANADSSVSGGKTR